MQASSDLRFPIDNQSILYSNDPIASLTEMTYCLYMDESGITEID